MKKVYQIEIVNPTSMISNHNSLTNKTFKDQLSNKSLYKNFIKFKKTNTSLVKTLSKPLNTNFSLDKSKDNHFNSLNVLATDSSSSLPKINSSLLNINGFELLEKIFRFIKPKISNELYTDFKRFIYGELKKIEVSSLTNKEVQNISSSSMDDILSNGISKNIINRETETNIKTNNCLSSKLNLKLLNNLNKNGIIQKNMKSTYMKNVSVENISLITKSKELKMSSQIKPVAKSKVLAYKDLVMNYKIKNQVNKINSNNSKINFTKKSNDHIIKSKKTKLSLIKNQFKSLKDPKLNEISIDFNEIISHKNSLVYRQPQIVKTSESISDPKTQKKVIDVKLDNKYNDMINKKILNEIKMKIDDNLKHLFNFSYDNFHSKEINESIVSNNDLLND